VSEKLSVSLRWTSGIVNREELLHDVWETTHDPGTNVIEVTIRRLRTKLGPRIVETVRNAGYTFGGVSPER
jgi:DNA-binding response OmpR family regulator